MHVDEVKIPVNILSTRIPNILKPKSTRNIAVCFNVLIFEQSRILFYLLLTIQILTETVFSLGGPYISLTRIHHSSLPCVCDKARTTFDSTCVVVYGTFVGCGWNRCGQLFNTAGYRIT